MPPSRPALINLLTRLPHLGDSVRNAHDAWLRRRIDGYWRAAQTPARKSFDANKPILIPAQQRVLADLSSCGVAQAHFTELFSDSELWNALSHQVREWIESEKIKERTRSYTQEKYRDAKWKEYIVMMTAEEGATFSIDSPLARIGLQPAILDIVNSYFGMMTRLFHMDVWKTIPLEHDGPLTGSQRWHRDPEDVKLVKVFLYLSDVDESAGPLHYLKHSRRGEKYGHCWPQKLPYGNVAPVDQLERVAPRSDWAVCTAPAGTFIFADTTGLHMGGRAGKNERIFAVWGFASHGAVWPRYFQLDLRSGLPQTPPAVRYALFE